MSEQKNKAFFKAVEKVFDSMNISYLKSQLNVCIQHIDFLILEKDQLLSEALKLKEALEKSQKRLAYVENWHRDNITEEYFKDCQEVGMTPEQYLREGKNDAREAIAQWNKYRGNNG